MAIIDSPGHVYEANTPKRPWHTVPNWPDHVTGDEMVAVMVCASVLIGLPAMAQAPAEVTLAHIDCGTGATPTDVGQRFTDTYASR